MEVAHEKWADIQCYLRLMTRIGRGRSVAFGARATHRKYRGASSNGRTRKPGAHRAAGRRELGISDGHWNNHLMAASRGRGPQGLRSQAGARKTRASREEPRPAGPTRSSVILGSACDPECSINPELGCRPNRALIS
jgi:hypothetical protein